MCVRESSIQRSGQTVFIVSSKLPSFTIWDPVTESSISCSLWTKVHRKCIDCSSLSRFIFTNSQISSHYSKHTNQNFEVRMSLQMCHTFVHNLHAIQQNSSHHSVHPNSSRRSILHDSVRHESTTCQWHKHVPFCADS